MSRLENKYRNRTLISDYAKQVLSMLSIRFPDKDPEILKGIIKSHVKEMKKGSIVADGATWEIPTIDKIILDEQPILTGSGTLYRRHDQVHNDQAGMLIEFSEERSKNKNLKKKYQGLGDNKKKKYYDDNQKSWKVMSNSYYGVQAQGNSQFYNNHSAFAITSSSVDAIQTAINFFEKFLYGNVILRDINDAFQYMTYIIGDEYSTDIDNILDQPIEIDRSDLLTRISEFFKVNPITHDDKVQLASFIANLTDLEVKKIYLKNNLLLLLENSNIPTRFNKLVIDSHFQENKFLDSNKPTTEEMKSELTDIGNYIKDWVGYFHQDFYRYQNVDKEKRRSVLLSDTDSTFLYLGGVLETISKKSGFKLGEETPDDIVMSNLVMNIVVQVSDVALYRFYKLNNVPDDQTHLLNMKSEFLSKKIMLTDQKKNYAHLILLNEGVRLPEPELEVKGMAIKKVSTSRKIREKIIPVLENEVLASNEIDFGKIIKVYKDMESDIYNSLMNGELDYTLPISVKEFSSYDNPMSVSSVKGMYVWNSLFPDQAIVPPERLKSVKVDLTSWDEVKDKIPDGEFKDRLRTLMGLEDVMGKSGISTIAIGGERKTIPDELRPLIDVPAMISSHIKSARQLLESIGVHVAENSSRTYPTNIINF